MCVVCVCVCVCVCHDLPSGHIPPNGTFNWVDKNTFQRSWKPLKMREIYRARLRAVRAVDEMIAVVGKHVQSTAKMHSFVMPAAARAQA